MKTVRLIDAGTYYRTRTYYVSDDLELWELDGFEPIEDVRYESNYDDREITYDKKEDNT